MTAAGGNRPGPRRCEGCGGRLSRYNPDDLCQACGGGRTRAGSRPPAPDKAGGPAGAGPDVPGAGARLAELRRGRGLTQEALAEQAGLSLDVVRKLEQGQRKTARMATLAKLAGVLGVGVPELLGEQDGAAAGDLARRVQEMGDELARLRAVNDQLRSQVRQGGVYRRGPRGRCRFLPLGGPC